ncbi:unnamed protein product [Cochlearia groenlandica]
MVKKEELEIDVEIKCPADKFHMLFGGAQHLSKATRYVNGCELLEGGWGQAGSIVLWNLAFDGEERLSKDRVETVDVEKKVVQWTVLDGPLRKEYKSLLKTMKVTPQKEGFGSVVNWNLKYERVDEKVPPPDKVVRLLSAVTKEADLYLLSEE